MAKQGSNELRNAIRRGTDGPPAAAALGPAIAGRALSEGLLDVAWSQIDSPVGTLTAASTPRGLVMLSFPGYPLAETLGELAERIGPRVLEAPQRFDRVRRELEEYFEGRRRQFDLELDWRLIGGFTLRVLEQTNRIPFGETRSYSEMAALAGSPRAFRAAGSALGANPIPIIIPCHRVLRTGGGIGGYGGGLPVKRTLLELEGVTI